MSLIAAAAVATLANAVFAEFKVGAGLPGVTLPSTSGATITIERADGTLRLRHGDQTSGPKVLAIHLLQPDCLQCRAQLQALQELYSRFHSQGLAVIGVSHRGNEQQLTELAQELRLTFPLALGTGSDFTREFAAGDAFALIDREGTVRFAQVGYGAGDEKTWAENMGLMLAGKSPAKEGLERDRLGAGDRFPAVVLPSIHGGKTMELAGKGGRLVFRGDDNKETRPKAAVGFFSRY